MLWQDYKQHAVSNLEKIYESSEAKVIFLILAEEVFPQKNKITLQQDNFSLNEEELLSLKAAMERLMQHEPIQYVINKAWFYDLCLEVNPSVLIPRPETEELVLWILESAKGKAPKILDIGTGSGCIAISLAKHLPSSKVSALDIDASALQVAKKNAASYNTPIQYIEQDILDEKKWNHLEHFDIIVSNPPYIPVEEKSKMAANVLQHEPSLALFVADENPLLFYKKIAQFSLLHLNKNGNLFFECNEYNALELKDLLQKMDFIHVEVKKDLQGKDRMIQASF